MNYHGHVYYRDKKQAQQAREQLRANFDENLHLFPLREKAIGPHPVPFFGLSFEQTHLPKIRIWMTENADWMIGLIHPVIADDISAHTTYAEWIGGSVPLDLSKMSSPPTTYGDLALKLKSHQPKYLDVNHFDIYSENTLVGQCILGAHYERGHSVLNHCRIYELQVPESMLDTASRLVVQYLKRFTDCTTILAPAKMQWLSSWPEVDLLSPEAVR